MHLYLMDNGANLRVFTGIGEYSHICEKSSIKSFVAPVMSLCR